MVNRILTSCSVTLAVPSFIFIFNQDKCVITKTTLFTFFVSLLLFWLESFSKRNGSNIMNRLSYFFSKLGEYTVEEKQLLYERTDDTHWEFQKKYILRSNVQMLEKMEDRFYWSADSSGLTIDSMYGNQSVCNTRMQEIWTVFDIKFNRIYHKKERIETGVILRNLEDKLHRARPFLSSEINEKTKLMDLVVKLPPQYKPASAFLKVYPPNSKKEVKSEVLAYNDNEQEISARIYYPRKHWKYVIVWEYRE